MLEVKFGEKSPRVVALQILLNRYVTNFPRLVTDGAYGKLTRAAVNAFRERIMRVSGPDGVADPAMWRFLLTRAKLQVIDSIDVTDPTLLEFVVPEVSKWSDPVVMGGMSNGATQLVTEVRARAQGERSLLMLRLHGHGAPGLIALSHGSRRVTPGVDPFLAQSVISNNIMPALTPLLQQLTPLMHNMGFIELHSCRVGEGAVGAAFVKRFADAMQAPVRAALSVQPMNQVFTLTGNTFTGIPSDRSLAEWGMSRDEGVRPGPPIPRPPEWRERAIYQK
jgi:hypothetical protein